jgi:hypothetical protein
MPDTAETSRESFYTTPSIISRKAPRQNTNIYPIVNKKNTLFISK